MTELNPCRKPWVQNLILSSKGSGNWNQIVNMKWFWEHHTSLKKKKKTSQLSQSVSTSQVPQEQKQNPVPALRCIRLYWEAKLTWEKQLKTKAEMCILQRQAGWGESGRRKERLEFGGKDRVGNFYSRLLRLKYIRMWVWPKFLGQK